MKIELEFNRGLTKHKRRTNQVANEGGGKNFYHPRS